MTYRNQRVLFTDANMNTNIMRIIQYAAGPFISLHTLYALPLACETHRDSLKDKAKADPIRYPYVTVMVVGMPNVGKSSLINAMRRVGVRKGKAAKTGPEPGVTRSIVSSVKVLED